MASTIRLELTDHEVELIKIFLHYSIETCPIEGVAHEHGLEAEKDDLWDLIEKIEDQKKAQSD
ncbi:MAG: hypothetical protein A2V83_08415 [Nitrospirae bacterium RBG_16_64_22]|nr:MAG: hypothetical protein A2V83_08415 [Nitrospirae bacterium RBG_16_64_22]